jgi:hypothetical protein
VHHVVDRITPRSKNGGPKRSPSRSATVAGLRHCGGGAAPGGSGGPLRPTNANIRPMKCSGGRVANATRPPGLGTRRISATTTSGRGANMCPNWLTTTSSRRSPGAIPAKRSIPTRWNSLSVTAGVGWDVPVAPDLVLRPILNASYGRVTSDAQIGAAIADVDVQCLENGRMAAVGFGGWLMLDHERHCPEGDLDAELRHVLELAHTRHFGDLESAPGFDYLSSVGVGLELDTSKHERWVTRLH